MTKNKSVHSSCCVSIRTQSHNERTGSIHLRSCDNDRCAPCGTTAATHRTCRCVPHYSSAQLNAYNHMENPKLNITVHDTHSRGLTIQHYRGWGSIVCVTVQLTWRTRLLNASWTKGFLFNIQNEHTVSGHKQKCNSTSSPKEGKTGLEAIFAKPTNDQQLVYVDLYSKFHTNGTKNWKRQDGISMFHRAFFDLIIDGYQQMHFFTFNTVLV